MVIPILNTHYILLGLMFCWFAYRYRHNVVTLLLVVIFFDGVFDYFIPQGTQYMRLITFIWSCYVIVKQRLWNVFLEKRNVGVAFLTFSIYFVLDTLLICGDSPVQVFSQYSKYFIPVVLLLSFFDYAKHDVRYIDGFNRLFLELIIAQVIITVLKMILFRGSFYEGMVGTFGGVRGGGSATGFPLVALVWLTLNSNMDIRRWKTWIIYVAGLLLLGVMAGKRAVIVLYPTLFILLGMYVAKRKYPKQVMYILFCAPLIFYLGLRLTPTLNPEKKVWGSFDPAYAWHYAMDYSFGEETKSGEREQTGRMGANMLLWIRITDVEHYTQQSWFGYGVTRIYSANYEKYRDSEYNFGLDHRGSMTGVFMLYIAIGLIGVILCFIYYGFLFSLVPYKRLRWVMWALVMFDFIFYNNTMIREPSLAILTMFCIVFSYVQYTKEGQFVGHKYIE